MGRAAATAKEQEAKKPSKGKDRHRDRLVSFIKASFELYSSLSEHMNPKIPHT